MFLAHIASILCLAALPALALIIYFVKLDRARPEPVGLIARSVLYGFIAVLPAVGIELFLMRLVKPRPTIGSAAFHAFVVAGLVEESVKLFFVKRYLFKRPEFDAYRDGIVYAICLSLGFAFAENFLYGFGNPSALFFRAFTSVPGHAIFSGVMGYHVGIAKLDPTRPRAWIRGLAWAAALHGLYDFLLMAPLGVGAFVLPLILFGWLGLRGLLRRADALDAEKARGARYCYQNRSYPIL